jgi:NAD(P)-dependent dehydrogenase (short-subunit alcohol dehydrogenase family)
MSASTGYAFVGTQNLQNDLYPAITASSTPALQQPGKVVLITGAGRGIGRAIALQYAHASVAAIILCARTTSELDEVESSIKTINAAVKVYKHTVDVTSPTAVSDLASTVKNNEGGRLDVLVNNAGASAPWIPLTDSDPATWWNTFEVNLKGPFLFLHAFLPLLTATAEKKNTAVHVVNVSSIGAHIVSPGASAYQISKLAVLRLCEFVKAEYGDKGVEAVGVHPGGVLTALSEKMESLRPSKCPLPPHIYSSVLRPPGESVWVNVCEFLLTLRVVLNDTPGVCGGFIVWLTAKSRAWLSGRYVSATWDVDALASMEKEVVEGNKLKISMTV